MFSAAFCRRLSSILFLALFAAPATLPADTSTPYTITRELKRFNGDSDKPRIMEFTAGFSIEGLWGPIPEENQALAYLDKSYPAASMGHLSHQPDTGPFLKITGYQIAGQQVSIKVDVPEATALGTLTNSDGDDYWFVRPEKRRVIFNQVLWYGSNDEETETLTGLQVDEEAGTMSWTPARREHRGKMETLAPVLVEVLVEYQCKHGLFFKNNANASWEKPTTYTFRLGWLQLPPCGEVTDDTMVTCPATFPAVASWKIRSLDGISLAVPDTWDEELSPDKDQGQWEIDNAKPRTAGVALLRDVELDKILESMEHKGPEKATVNGEPATMYRGRVTKRELDSVVYVFDRKDSKGRTVFLGVVAANWQTSGPLLETITSSLTFGDTAKTPEVSADLTTSAPGGQLVISTSPLPAPEKLLASTEHSAQPEAAEQPAPQPAQGGKLSLEEQETLAAELFQKMVDTPEDQPDTFIELYQRVMTECPDTEKAEISYWRLANLYLYGFDPPKFAEITTLLETFLTRYPNSEGVGQVKQRLLNAYEQTGRWCDAAELYAQIVPNPLPDDIDNQQLALASLYASALDQCGKGEDALFWQREIVRVAGDQDTLEVRAAKEALGAAEAGAAATAGQPAAIEQATTPSEDTAAAPPQDSAGPQPQPKQAAPEQQTAPVTPAATATVAPKLSARLIRKKSVIDHVGRNEELKGNGAADSRVRATITAPGSTIVAIHLKAVNGLETGWDTVAGNDRWLIAATRGKEMLNLADGSISYQVPDGEQAFDLWVQDNNAIAGGKTTFQLVVEMADGTVAETQVSDE